MIGDERGDLRSVVIGESQPTADLLRHASSDLDVLVESNSAIRPRRRCKRRGLANVMKQDAPRERRRAPRR
jgi:hypothetical protein